MDEFEEELKAAGLTVKVEKNLNDYLSCEIRINADLTKAWIGQPHLIQNLQDKFGDIVKDLQSYKTPGTPHQGIVCPTEENVKVSAEEQRLF